MINFKTEIARMQKLHKSLNIKQGDIVPVSGIGLEHLSKLSTIRLKHSAPAVVHKDGGFSDLIKCVGLQTNLSMSNNGYPYGYQMPKDADKQTIYKSLISELETTSQNMTISENLKDYLSCLKISTTELETEVEIILNALIPNLARLEGHNIKSVSDLYMTANISEDEKRYATSEAGESKELKYVIYVAGAIAQIGLENLTRYYPALTKEGVDQFNTLIQEIDFACWKGMLKQFIPIFYSQSGQWPEVGANFDYSACVYEYSDSDSPNERFENINHMISHHLPSFRGMTSPDGNFLGVILSGIAARSLVFNKIGAKLHADMKLVGWKQDHPYIVLAIKLLVSFIGCMICYMIFRLLFLKKKQTTLNQPAVTKTLNKPSVKA